MLITSPSGPCVVATLGVSAVSARKLRPLFGSPFTTSSDSGVAKSLRDVLIGVPARSSTRTAASSTA